MYQLTKVDKTLVFVIMASSFIYLIYICSQTGFLPPPFFYDKSDSFMDLFHVLFWSNDNARYTEWKSIYTPFSFVMVKLLAILRSDNITLDPWALRKEYYAIALTIIFIAGIVLSSIQYKLKKNYSFILVLSFMLSSPFLFAIERGNLIVFTYLFLLLAMFFYRKVVLFSLFLALAISLKIYLIALLFIPLMNKQFQRVVLTLFLVVIVNVFSGLFLGDNNWLLFVSNIFTFSGDPHFYEWSYFTYSYQNMLLGLVDLYPQFNSGLKLLNSSVLVICLVLFSATSIKYSLSNSYLKQQNKETMYLLLLMLIMVVVKNSGGYVFILLFPFISSLLVSRFSLYLIIAMIVPFEVLLIPMEYTDTLLFSNDSVVTINKGVSSGMFIRPIVFLWCYFLVSIRYLKPIAFFKTLKTRKRPLVVTA